MKVLVWHGPRILILEERSQPQPGPDEALIKVCAAGICGSELEGYLGQSSLRVPPLIMGHEFSGEVVALGPTGGEAPSIGQLVTVNPLLFCGDCMFCQAGFTYLCPQRKLIGAHLPGAFADFVVVPLRALIPLPEAVDPLLGALTEPFAVALHGVGLAHLASQHGVVVWGAGTIGLLTICAARLAQPACIIAVDTNPARLEAAKTVGATLALDARESDVLGMVRALLKDVPHTVVFDAVGRSSTRQVAATVAGSGGQVVLLGLHDRETAFDVAAIIRSEVALQGSYAYTVAEIHQAVALLAGGHVPTAPWVEVRGLASGPDAFAELVDKPGAATKIILVPEAKASFGSKEQMM